jgi:ribose transport system permease protein
VNHGMAVVPALLLTVAAAVAIGLFNAFVVVRLRIDSFIATLATGSLMDALVDLLSNNQSISGNQLYGTFGKLSTVNIQGIDLPLGIMVVVSVSLWFLQGYTVLGRRIYATGFNEPGSRLAGIRTQRIRFGSLVVSGFVAGIAGILLASEVSAGSPNIGPPYLLGAYAAAFLGATQFVRRFNAWGTVIAVMMLGTGTTGLSLIGANTWAQSLFTGAVLLCSLALTNVQGTFSLRERLNFSRASTTGDEARDVQSAPPSTTG